VTSRVLFFAKTDSFCDQALAIAQVAFGDALVVHRGKLGDPFPVRRDDAGHEPLRGILSFVSPWIVPAWLLERVPPQPSGWALNFHPGSTDYPGIGCYNFALYEGAAEFGAVCHHMAPAVDTGAIVLERRFPLLPADSVASLKLRTMVTMVSMFHDVVIDLSRGQPPPVSSARWGRRPFRRAELEALCEITADMTEEEVRRRVRAVTFPGAPGARITIHGIRFDART
jgi:methionyl-tRNA formyltransferase